MIFLFSLLACCQTLNVTLYNDVKDKYANFEGVYTFQGFSDGMDYWVDAKGEYAIWYVENYNSYEWIIGYLSRLGSLAALMYSSSNILVKKCPNNEGYVLNWNYGDGSSWIVTNDVYIKCANENDFCTSDDPCGTDDGDCDIHDECKDGLVCGSNNCPDSLGFDSEFDCCFAPNVGDENFCASGIPCGENEGDCDSNYECQANLVCDIANNCTTSLGFLSDVNCCVNISKSGCKYK